MSANLTIRAEEDLDGDMFGVQAVTGTALSGAGRSIIFDGINDWLNNDDTGTAVPASQSGWRFMTRVRGLVEGSSGAGNAVFRDTSAAVLTLQHFSGGTGFGRFYAYVGPAADATGFVTLPAADCIVLVRCNPASTEVSMEIWDLAGSNRAAAQVTSASGSATNFQNRLIRMGSAAGSTDFFAGKCDRALFKTGAGTYNAAAPDVLNETADILDWTFDADNGVEAVHGVNFTLNGTPAFENTP